MIIDILQYKDKPYLTDKQITILKKMIRKTPYAGLTKTVTIPHMCFDPNTCGSCLYMRWQSGEFEGVEI